MGLLYRLETLMLLPWINITCSVVPVPQFTPQDTVPTTQMGMRCILALALLFPTALALSPPIVQTRKLSTSLPIKVRHNATKLANIVEVCPDLIPYLLKYYLKRPSLFCFVLRSTRRVLAYSSRRHGKRPRKSRQVSSMKMLPLAFRPPTPGWVIVFTYWIRDKLLT